MSATLPTSLIRLLLGPALVLAAACDSGQQSSNISTGSVPAAAAPRQMPQLSGPYLGQTPPGDEPELFAPGIVSTGLHTRDLTMTPDGSEIYYSVALPRFSVSTIMVTRLEDGAWTEPQVAAFASDPRYMSFEPHISPDGKRLFFLSNRPQSQGGVFAVDQNIWVMDRLDTGWCEPYSLGPPVNTTGQEYFPSVTTDGTLYFTREGPGRASFIYRSRFVDERYSEPEKLPPQVNAAPTQFNSFISPDESFLILCAVGLAKGFGATDYYVCFRNPDDTWTQPINLGPLINTTGGNEFSPSLSPDGKYFFFMSSRMSWTFQDPPEISATWLHDTFAGPQNGDSDIYWVDASFINMLRPHAE